MSSIARTLENMNIMTVSNPHDFFAEIEGEVLSENPGHRSHLGKYILKAMRRHQPDATSQIDAATDEMETFGSLLNRSIATAQAFRNTGMQIGDIVAVIGSNHLDVVIPFYASLFTGITFMGLDGSYENSDLSRLLHFTHPKIIFCDLKFLSKLQDMCHEIGIKLVTFGKETSADFPNFQEYLKQNKVKENMEEFRATDFDPSTTTATICVTSGSTGQPKLVELSHVNLAPRLTMFWAALYAVPKTLIVGTISPVFWVTSNDLNLYTAMYCLTRVQSSKSSSPMHVIDMVNKYKPMILAMPPQIAQTLLKSPIKMDWTCFHTLVLCGSAVDRKLIDAINKEIGRPTVKCLYGTTETSGNIFYQSGTEGSLGVPLPYLKAKLVDPDSLEEIQEHGHPGELWVKGCTVFKGYFKDPEGTKAAITSDGWYRTGDMFLKDEKENYFFVERLKNFIYTVVKNTTGQETKYLYYKISPCEIEQAIKNMSGVDEVVVTGIWRDTDEHPVALVVKKLDHQLTAAEIINHVAETLSVEKHLTGGVLFVDSIPLLPTGKYDRMKVRKIAKERLSSLDSFRQHECGHTAV